MNDFSRKCVAIVLAGAAWAGPTAGTGTAQETHEPRPLNLEPSWIPQGPDTMALKLEADGQVQRTVVQVEELALLRREGRPVLRQVLTVATPRGPLVDTTLYSALDLSPMAHASHSAMRDFSLTYRGDVVSGRYTSADSSYAIRRELDRPVYDPGASQLLIRFMDLDVGDAYRIPFFSHEALAVVWQTVEAARVEPVTLADGSTETALVVEQELPDGRTVTHWIGRESRRALRVEAPAGPGRRMVYQR